MVEFYHAKKRRGIAGLSGRTTTRVVEPKPYWPGLEIDEHDRDKSRHGSNNNSIDNNENTDAMKSNIETSAKENMQDNDKTVVSIGRVEESSAINSNAEGETKPSPSMNDSRKGNTNRYAGSISTFRSRKRKRNPSANNNYVSDNALPQLPGNNSMTGEEQEGGSDTANTLVDTTSTSTTVGTANEVTRKCSQPIVKTMRTSTTNIIGSLTNVSTNNNHATAKATDAIKTITPAPARKTNNHANDNNSDDLSSVSSSSETRATPRVLVNFLLHQKFPVLDQVVSDIRDILSGMVSRSPALLQKHLARAATTSPALTGANTGNDREINNSNNNNNTNNSHGGMDHNYDALKSEQKQPPQQETISKLQDICKRQEMLLDRITGMESAATRREIAFLKQTQEEEQAHYHHQHQQQEQRQCQEEDSTAKLQRDYQTLQETNANLQMKLERKNTSIETYRLELKERGKTIGELEGSKRSIHCTFQSRFDEQFRELSERECIIEKQRNLLRIARLENEKLRNRIVVLEEERPRSVVEAEVNHAYNSHRIRHTNGQEEKLLCSFQATTGSSLRTSTQDRDGNTIHGTTSSAYNPRVRRNARVRDNT
jgi:hypothetical protein